MWPSAFWMRPESWKIAYSNRWSHPNWQSKRSDRRASGFQWLKMPLKLATNTVIPKQFRFFYIGMVKFELFHNYGCLFAASKAKFVDQKACGHMGAFIVACLNTQLFKNCPESAWNNGNVEFSVNLIAEFRFNYFFLLICCRRFWYFMRIGRNCSW